MEAVEREERDIEKSWRKYDLQKDLVPILQLRGRERMEAILDSDRPRELFQALPEEEAYFTIKEIGEQDALPLLSLMSPGQCQYLLDLELWKGYELQLENVERWLPLLLSCDGEAVAQWLRSIDLDTLLLILKKTIRVHVQDSEGPNLTQDGGTPHFTLDGTYYIEILTPTLQNQIEQLLRHLAETDLNFYWKVLHQVSWEIGTELEERALHFREARLEDRGFPPMEEALSLYQYLNPGRLKQMLEQKEIHLPGIPEEPALPSFPMILKDHHTFFSLCLRELGEGLVVDRLKMELAYMANQVMVADQPERIDLQTLQESLKKVGGYLSVGLELLSQGDVRRARKWIEQIPLKFVFQVGFGASLELKWRAERIWEKGWYSDRGLPLSFLGSPWEERVEGLLKKRPLFWDGVDEMEYREFRSLEEIRSLRRDLDEIELVGKVLSSLPPFSYSDGLVWKTVLLTAYIRDQTEPQFQEMPNTIEGTTRCLNQLLQKGIDIEGSFNHWLLKKVAFKPENEISLLREITTLVLKDSVPYP
ncbi:MAG: hypothetical protein HXY46_03100 [Syntrophaceae bacterium]|nr:hypothetical protein [Syntrophaceae bacterium]